MTVRFSVFMPMWNDTEWLPGAIESLLAQKHQDWELVIGDNASTEDAASVISKYADPRIRHHRWETHTDIYENHNRTLLLCEYEWVQMLSADDRLHPDCMQRMAERIEAERAGASQLAMVIAASARVDAQGRPADLDYYGHQRIMQIRDGLYGPAEWFDVMCAPGQTPWNAGSVAMLRSLLAEIGSLYRPEIGLCADVELVLRLAAYGNVAYISEPLLYYTVRGSSDMGPRALRNLSEGDPSTPIGAAWASALRVHERSRPVSRLQRGHIHAAIARSHLQRALQHRVMPGGHGRRGAAVDVWRAFKLSPGIMLSTWRLATALLAIVAPARMVSWATRQLTNRRRDEASLKTASLGL
ncbi:MAG: glycosyltransferase [Dehalococcoidia bacterium]|nr:glycosyltransferase [Dehalococcoidia bacterium]